ncbi:bleomycin resistance protein [Filifactor villosus]|uniref:Bleomycin resistance protein n=1 Tax=Filifactor villosus TaxID=29374 RepID=A0ABV9QPM3_9FIRM
MKYNDLIPELIVSDIEKSKHFYIDILGFQIEYERSEDKFVFLSLNEIQLMIEQGSKEELKNLSYPFGRGVNFSFGVDNVEEIYERFRSAGYPIKKELETRRFRVGDLIITPMEFAVLDPDGYYIRITD